MTAVSRRVGGRRWRALLTVIVLVGVAAAGVFAFSRRSTPANQRLNYALVRPQRGPLIATVGASGTIQPRAQLNLSFSAPDTVAEILVQPGQRVERGTALARLDDAELKLRLDQARATLAQAEAGLRKLTAGA
ncbi:MAG: biotin/lipoyl-binding protein, partial [Chloroflexales bacterium]|nr:biotin/lipoyl-binding protein [Chloroflexales bacterium]